MLQTSEAFANFAFGASVVLLPSMICPKLDEFLNPPTNYGFTVVFGNCTTSGACLQSPNFPDAEYPDNTACLLTVNLDSYLNVTSFCTEGEFDYFVINGSNDYFDGYEGEAEGALFYSGEDGPQGVFVTAGTIVTFNSDSSVTEPGFEICALKSPT
mmetsp:Transcript_35960/g.49922  ORF Transcript_35960/g.49922 Transcript_35960/m.49922 type:complete len:156 (-) Transcript_35960:127-594(-)